MNKYLLKLKPFFLRDPGHWKFWIGMAIVVKGLLFIHQVTQNRPAYVDGFIGHITGDVASYIDPVENLISMGSYSPDYRLPGYGLIYLPLRILFSKALALNILITLQMLVAAVSVYVLAATAKRCFRSDALFYIVYYVYCVSSYTNLFDSFILTESFCTSASIFAVYFFSRHLDYGFKRDLFISGSFIVWVIFLRPMFAPLPAIFLSFLALDVILKKNTLQSLIRSAIILLIPLLLIETAWTTRNYINYKRVIPLTTSLYAREFEDSYVVDLLNFVKSWGGDGTWWTPGSEMRWFGAGDHLSFADEKIVIPEYIYTSAFSKDSLLMIKQYVKIIVNPQTTISDQRKYTALVKKKLPVYTVSVKNEKPFLFYVKGPLILLKRFFIHSGTYNLFHKTFNELNPAEFVVKVFYSLLYVATIALGMVGLVMAGVMQRKNMGLMLICSLAVYSILLFPFVLRLIEYRYFLPAYPFLLMMACYTGLSLFNKLRAVFSGGVSGAG